VDIYWRIDAADRNVARMIWRETGGPPIVEEPERRGFGTTLIRSTFSEADAGVDLRYETTGVVCEIRIPVSLQADHGVQHPADAVTAVTATAAPPVLAGIRVLLAEDEPIVQMELQDCLVRAGAAVLGPVSTLDAAHALAKSGAVDAAILDVNLSGRSIAPVAEFLHARGIPILFTTGYHDLQTLPPALRQIPRLQNPSL
jgi:CheY-like chemotaxis protein